MAQDHPVTELGLRPDLIGSKARALFYVISTTNNVFLSNWPLIFGHQLYSKRRHEFDVLSQISQCCRQEIGRMRERIMWKGGG